MAPTDAAFAALNLFPSNVADTPDLPNILGYHVIEGKRRALSLLFEREVTMFNGDTTEFSLDFFPLAAFVNESRIINANNRTKNAIVHVIDEVLLPPMPMVESQALTYAVQAVDASAAAIPEPSSLALAGMLAAVGAATRRSR